MSAGGRYASSGVLEATVARDGRLPPGSDGQSNAFRRAQRCPEAGE